MPFDRVSDDCTTSNLNFSSRQDSVATIRWQPMAGDRTHEDNLLDLSRRVSRLRTSERGAELCTPDGLRMRAMPFELARAHSPGTRIQVGWLHADQGEQRQ